MTSYATNNRAGFDYEFLTRYEAGLVLHGYEVKAVKTGKLTLTGARVVIRGGSAYLLGASLQPYQPHNLPPDFESQRTLPLLLTKKEISELVGVEKQKGLTIIPLSVYSKNGRLKLTLAVARGKKKYDKREMLKKREVKRQMERTLKTER